jgi:NADP-dependent 3-hydroxy acid dehydrogenase YdfG
MSLAFEGKTAVITGCTSGIGRATAEALLAAGAEVVGLGRDEQRLAAVRSELGGGFTSITADLSSPASLEQAGARLAELGRKVDIFVSNAAECSYDSLLDIDPEAALRLFQVNVVALATLARVLVPLMRGGGQIVQLSSVTARYLPGPKFAAYAATKRAVETYAEALRLELAPLGIRVALIAPGLVDTPIYDKVRGFESARRKLETQIPEWLRPADITDAILFVASRPPHVAITDIVLYPTAQTR